MKDRYFTNGQYGNEILPPVEAVSAAGKTLLIDLNTALTGNRKSVCFYRMRGDVMQDAGIFDNDILIVDTALPVQSGKIIVALLNGEMLVRRYHKNSTQTLLIAANKRYKDLNPATFSSFTVTGVVTYIIHPV